ncbi:MAG: lamin tail domain-containing protein [Bacteroidetes bacterium]|nr:lamin tail domain-containing protein [Bacteroidota bacterium]
MKLYYFLSLLFFLGYIPAHSQVRINEIQTSNKTTLADEDGDYGDWIEVFNAGPAVVDLSGYGISDDPSNVMKWKFPAINLPSGSQLLVFASGKNRKPLVNHWETAVYAQDIWRYYPAAQQPPSNWNTLGFDESGWLQGMGGIGYGDGDDSTVIDPVISVYMRKTFEIADTAAMLKAIFSMDYDDGFVAYLNGVEIARSNLVGVPPAFNELTTVGHEAQLYSGGIPEEFIIDSVLLRSLIRPGENVLAVETHNVDASSSDLSSIPFLSFGIGNSTHYFQPVPSWFLNSTTGSLHANFKLSHSGETVVLSSPQGEILDSYLIPYSDVDHSFCRIPDGASNWCISTTPSPNQSNNSSACNSGYAEEPIIELAPGFYPTTRMTAIHSTTSGSEIHYTTNGNIPQLSDPVYTQALILDATKVIRARCFGPAGLLPGKTATSTFIIGDHDYKIPVISISTDSLNLWDYFSGIYIMGPFAEPDFPYFGANFWQPWEKDSHIEYFGPMQDRKFELDAGLSIHGGWSRAFDQRSFNIKTHSYYDSSEIHYKLFGEKPFTNFKSFILRNSGNDWMVTHMRDALMQRVMRFTNVDYMAYCPSAVFLNGQYWGIYNIRERNNNDFVELNHGINADSVDVIISDGEVSSGTSDAFWEMYNFISTHELTFPANYQTAKSYWNILNYMDYFVAETYYNNGDWIGEWTNNIKLWRQRKPGAKWNYILWDMDFGLGYYGPYTENKLYEAINPNVPTPHADIFRQFLGNMEFRQYFINRYADLINTLYQPSNMYPIIYEMKDSISSEMPFAWERWFAYRDSLNWLNNISNMMNFINNRPIYARQQINSTFGLQGEVILKLSVVPEGAGYIKINTVIPEHLPWLGTYFHGNPIKITAIAAPGYTFQNWLPNSYIESDTNHSLTIDLEHYDNFKAMFFGTLKTPQVTFSEVNYHSDSTRNSGDWVEFHNFGNFALDISDWHLKNSKYYNDYVFATGTTISPNGYLVIAEDTLAFHIQHPGVTCLGPLGFSLGNKTETITLLDLIRDTVITFHYADSVHWLEATDGLGRTMELRAGSMNLNDPGSWFAGCMGGSPGEAYQPCSEQLVISEINYNSADFADAGDWVELKNKGLNAIDLTGFKFCDSDDGHQYYFKPGTMLQPGAYLVLTGSDSKFTVAFPWVENKQGPFNFGLSGSGEALRIYDNTGKLYSTVVYDDESPWPTEPDGQGYTLELANDEGIMCDGTNWFAGCPTGSPGGPYTFPCHTGVEISRAPSFAVFPNPASSQLYILNEKDHVENVEISISDALGRRVLSKEMEFTGISSGRLPVNHLLNGVYFLRIENIQDHASETLKIVISR